MTVPVAATTCAPVTSAPASGVYAMAPKAVNLNTRQRSALRDRPFVVAGR